MFCNIMRVTNRYKIETSFSSIIYGPLDFLLKTWTHSFVQQDTQSTFDVCPVDQVQQSQNQVGYLPIFVTIKTWLNSALFFFFLHCCSPDF